MGGSEGYWYPKYSMDHIASKTPPRIAISSQYNPPILAGMVGNPLLRRAAPQELHRLDR